LPDRAVWGTWPPRMEDVVVFAALSWERERRWMRSKGSNPWPPPVARVPRRRGAVRVLQIGVGPRPGRAPGSRAADAGCT
jgi:hypothetical protein